MKKHLYLFILLPILFALIACTTQKATLTIDRFSLVNRHNILLEAIDTLGSLSVGNGNFAYTVDITGLQTFPEYYENGISLGTQSQWGWHSFPDSANYTLEEVLVDYETCNDHRYPIAIQHKEGRAAAATHYLRTNPHRLHLGLIGLILTKANGETVTINDIKPIRQELNLWEGRITSEFEVEGSPVKVILFAHQEQDGIAFKIESPLIAKNQLSVNFRFPYGNDCHVCPGYNWAQPEKHTTTITHQSDHAVHLSRKLDATTYHVGIEWNTNAKFTEREFHFFELTPTGNGNQLEARVFFNKNEISAAIPTFEQVQNNSIKHWQAFWESGGAIDFSECTDERAKEIERRVVLSQYLTKIQCASEYPPQETGLTFNSWYGKFHLEMHWWHGVHFALWNRPEFLEKSMPWYQNVIENARKTAQRQGFAGVRWQKMTAPEGRISPSSVGEFLVWQQPHPIYFAELLYRHKPEKATLNRYKDLVFQTAAFMASFAQLNPADGKYHLCHPLIPAQEIFHATETNDPPFELAYWYYALNIAQQWKARLGEDKNENWEKVVNNLAPLPTSDNLYLPAARALDAYTNHDNRRDHPVVVGAYGMLPKTPMVDPKIMANTFDEIMRDWNWETTWGWDYPMLAMTAARLGKPEMAIHALLLDVQKNTYLVNGHNYQDKRLRLYLPGNGGLLTAVAMMSAGWDDAPNKKNPGFPHDGKWKVKWENLTLMP